MDDWHWLKKTEARYKCWSKVWRSRPSAQREREEEKIKGGVEVVARSSKGKGMPVERTRVKSETE